jgi:hypothetical protein
LLSRIADRDFRGRLLAVTSAGRQVNEGSEKGDLFNKAAITAVSFKH